MSQKHFRYLKFLSSSLSSEKISVLLKIKKDNNSEPLSNLGINPWNLPEGKITQFTRYF